MARYGKQPVKKEGATITIEGTSLSVSGPKGSLKRDIPNEVEVKIEGDEVVVERKNDSKLAKSLQGTIRSHISNMVTGVTKGWSKTLEIVGAGYRAEVRGKNLVMQIGYSHPVEVEAPEGINFKVEKSNVTVDGVDKDLVGHISAIVRAKRKPEPYKGTGIKYIDEVITRKAGKQAAK